MNQERLIRLRLELEKYDLDAMLVRYASNLRYISGYSGSNGLALITRKDAFFLTDFRYKTQAEQEVTQMQLRVPREADLFAALAETAVLKAGMVCGFEGNRLSYESFTRLGLLFPGTEFRDMSMLMETLAAVKEESEILDLEKAAGITDKAFMELLNEIKPGISERQLDAKLSYIMKSLGSERDSFDTIVASGVNGAKPHHKPGDKLLREGEFITIDFGAMYQGYHADVTRTVCLGKADAKQKEIYDIVLQAQLKALAFIRAGITGKAADAVARDLIVQKGYGENFGHGLGHGLGYEIHAEPRLSPKYEEKLQVNQIVTVEPGIYIPGWGGVRIEDNVVVKEKDCRNLTTAPKNLLEL
ncbi:MAG: aminopeptidase P family protein [Candidatus Marinimicrobia bacterium]|jgi:Xaa-Pro aminopeptidase|nr:aminopeptidase P family protein [Candidatus Neomarinimicrobiota bacterium]MDD4961839.1 aminopeptidase P family protein [Candidatus Neomarinimicrobiota bacterium]MDD5709377.1 aminopeptidase P family protein [Candidatus Neomarinimicrobiota bacterium]MDX9777253.1 aminopeptidase P family protein [bacterium]